MNIITELLKAFESNNWIIYGTIWRGIKRKQTIEEVM